MRYIGSGKHKFGAGKTRVCAQLFLDKQGRYVKWHNGKWADVTEAVKDIDEIEKEIDSIEE